MVSYHCSIVTLNLRHIVFLRYSTCYYTVTLKPLVVLALAQPTLETYNQHLYGFAIEIVEIRCT